MICPHCDRDDDRLVRLVSTGSMIKTLAGKWTTLFICPICSYTYTLAKLRNLSPRPIIDQHAFDFIDQPAQPAQPERLL